VDAGKYWQMMTNDGKRRQMLESAGKRWKMLVNESGLEKDGLWTRAKP
jgi:hypothetical protein